MRFETTIDALFSRAVRRWPQRPFIANESGVRSYAEVEVEVDQLARGLIALGITPGDRVALWMSNRLEWVVAQFAATRCGAVLTPLNTRLRRDDLAHALIDSGARVLITQADTPEFSYLEVVRSALEGSDAAASLTSVIVAGVANHARLEAPFVSWSAVMQYDDCASQEFKPAANPHELAYILYTSGTTSRPKGVMLSHANLNNAFNLASRLHDGFRTFLISPLFAIVGCHNAVLTATLLGGLVVFQERFDARQAADLIDAHHCDGLSGIYDAARQIAAVYEREPGRQSPLTRAQVFPRTSAGIPLMKRLGIRFWSGGYGITEFSGPVTLNDVAIDRVEAEQQEPDHGLPWPGNEIRIIDDSGRALPAGDPGEIVVRSAQRMLGYFNLSEATRQTIDDEGWLHTGDLGVMSPTGRLIWIARKSDIYRSAGFNVAAREVEAFLEAVPGVNEVAVVACPHPERGEVATAFIVASKPDLDPASIRRFCEGRIASYKIPADVRIVDRLPKTASGKVRKNVLRDLLSDADTPLTDSGNDRVPEARHLVSP